MDKYLFTMYFTAAVKLATVAHLEQKDIGGHPYLLHPLTVSELCKSDKAKIVAVLHDVVEDSEFTVEDIRKHIPDEEILTAIDLLTKKKKDKHGEGYRQYLGRIKRHPVAREVKIADLMHNSNLSRIPSPTEKDIKRRKKYLNSLAYLMGETPEYIDQ
jgi:(p)ppGpp synthase/HD superfamily hydrolase